MEQHSDRSCPESPGGTPARAGTLPWLEGLFLVLPLVLVVIPIFSSSQNVHTGLDSTSFDRLALSLRTFWSEGVGVAAPTAWDPNFPLGTTVLYAVPHVLDIDPVLFGRLSSLVSALLAMAALGFLVGRAAGRELGAAAAASVWALPAFVRGAVVSGEEAQFCAGVLLGLLGLVGSHAALGRGDRRRAILLALLSCAAVNSTVLFRIDAALVVPGFALLGLTLGWRIGLPYALACGGSAWLHFFVGWSVQKAPLSFVVMAKDVTAVTASPSSARGLGELLSMFEAQVGGVLVLLLGISGAWVLFRSGGHAGRVFVGLSVWLHGVYGAAVLVSIPNPSIARYFVPLLVVWIPLAAVGCRELVGRLHPGAGRVAALGLVVLLLVTGGRESYAQVDEARITEGIEAAAEWLSNNSEVSRVMTTQHRAELVVLGELPAARIQPLRTPELGFAAARPVERQLVEARASHVVLVGFNEGVRRFRAARLADWEFAWQGGDVVIYRATSPAAR